MATGEGWDAEKMLELYLHDYMARKKMHRTAAIFKREANIPDHSVAIDSPGGFLHEWWSIFSDVYVSKQHESEENKAEGSLQAMQIEEIKQQQNYHSEESHVVVPHQQSPVQFPKSNDFDNILEQPAAIYSEIELSPLGLNKPNLSHSVAMTSSSMSPQMFEQVKQGNHISLGRSGLTDHIFSAFRNGVYPTPGPHDAVIAETSNGVDPAPLERWPVNAPNNQQQFQISPVEDQQPRFPLATPSTGGKRTSSTGNPADFCSSDLMLTKNETKGNNDQMMGSLTKTVEQQIQYDLPQRQPLRKARKKKGPSNLRTGGNPMVATKTDDNRSGVENVNSVFSQDGENVHTPSSVLKCHSSGSAENKHKGLNLEEVHCIRSSKHALSCCQFSWDGKLLAFAGSEGKVFVWNVEACYSASTTDQHSLPITDVRFRPNSSIFVTSSLDKTVKIWDASRPNKTYSNLCGHAGQVMSLDFHPRNTDLLCSCDSDDEIRLWSFANSTSINTFKGATKQVRFQPGHEKLLATASGNLINLFDLETSNLLLSFKGHIKDVLSISWDSSGEYLLSVSEESARLWSMKLGGKCIYELRANDKRFQSCTFHPGYQNLGIIGGHKSLEIWNPINSSATLSIPAHEGSVTALAQAGQTLLFASASDDCCVKLWK